MSTMEDYFDTVVAQLTQGDVLYTTSRGTRYRYIDVRESRGEDAIAYSINTNTKRVGRTFLNTLQHEFAINGALPDADWCNNHFPEIMNDGYCNYCVARELITTRNFS